GGEGCDAQRVGKLNRGIGFEFTFGDYDGSRRGDGACKIYIQVDGDSAGRCGQTDSSGQGDGVTDETGVGAGFELDQLTRGGVVVELHLCRGGVAGLGGGDGEGTIGCALAGDGNGNTGLAGLDGDAGRTGQTCLVAQVD